MRNAIAFFPWAYVEELLTVGPVRLLPFDIDGLPGDLPHVTQADINGILAAYATLPNKPVAVAALLEYGEWQSGMEMSAEVENQIFRARHFIGFAALSNRKLFRRGGDYTNFDTYQLRAQCFQPESIGTFAFTTRRRDGGTNQTWSNDMFAFHLPEHVTGSTKMDLDLPLLDALLNLPATHEHIYEAIVEFNQANTDSGIVPLHVEAVMCKIAYEWLLVINYTQSEFVSALKSRLADIPQEKFNGPMREAWFKRWHGDSEVLIAWAKDFHSLRGASSHPGDRNKFVYGLHSHLAFNAIFFPLLLKKVLADDGLYTMTELEKEHLGAMEGYLVHDPFAHDWKSGKSHPWPDVEMRVKMRHLALQAYSSLPKQAEEVDDAKE